MDYIAFMVKIVGLLNLVVKNVINLTYVSFLIVVQVQLSGLVSDIKYLMM